MSQLSLFTLPREIRDIIYDELFQVASQLGQSSTFDIPFAILRTSRQFHQEATPILSKHIENGFTKGNIHHIFFLAASKGCAGILKRLMAREGFDVTKEDCNSRTALSWASAMGHEGAVQYLLEQGSAVNAKDGNCRTPLWYAAHNGHKTVVQLLMAQADIAVNSVDINFFTPLSVAAENGHEEVVPLFLKHDQVKVNPRDYLYRTPLMAAAMNNHEAVVALLLAEKRVDINAESNEGWTLQKISERLADLGHEGILRLLSQGKKK